ncbi:MAG: nucleotidyltransferase [Bacteroidetes bacterium GWF2_40_14]|nr:MAG: nucleotidyltransferase [Bacteroidetes bacterium GWF2_40_14]
MKPTLLVLAAGMGSRYGGLKQLDGVGPSGETIMDYSVYDAIRAGFGKVVFVIRKCFRTEFEERIRTRYGNVVELGFVEQELDLIPPGFTVNPERTKPWGTGHAVLVAADLIDTPFAVINADDYYGQNSFSVLGKFLSGQDGKTGEYCMVGFNISNTLSESGKVSRGLCTVDDCCYLTSVEEHHNIAREGETIYATKQNGEVVSVNNSSLVSMNMWGFTPDLFKEGSEFFKDFLRKSQDVITAEFYIPTVVNLILECGHGRCKVLNTPDQWFGITFKDDRDSVIIKIGELVKNGLYPSPLFKI